MANTILGLTPMMFSAALSLVGVIFKSNILLVVGILLFAIPILLFLNVPIVVWMLVILIMLYLVIRGKK